MTIILRSGWRYKAARLQAAILERNAFQGRVGGCVGGEYESPFIVHSESLFAFPCAWTDRWAERSEDRRNVVFCYSIQAKSWSIACLIGFG